MQMVYLVLQTSHSRPYGMHNADAGHIGEFGACVCPMCTILTNSCKECLEAKKAAKMILWATKLK